MHHIASFVERHSLACVLVGISKVAAIVLCTGLRIDQDFMALLPPDAPEVQSVSYMNARNQADPLLRLRALSRGEHTLRPGRVNDCVRDAICGGYSSSAKRSLKARAALHDIRRVA